MKRVNWAKVGIVLQVAGIAFALLMLFEMWRMLPVPHSQPGVSAGPDAPRRVVLLAGALALAGTASLRWRWGELVLLLVAVVVAWHGLTNHFLLTTQALFLLVTNGTMFLVGAALAIVGLVVRALVARPASARRVGQKRVGVV